METFKVNTSVVKENPLEVVFKKIKDRAKEEADKGNDNFRMDVSVPRFTHHIDEVTDELEKTTNLSFSRSKISGLGLQHKDDTHTHWHIGVWID